MPGAAVPPAPVASGLVFVSYSREDADWQRRFTAMIQPLARERRLQVWSDDRLVQGYAWRPQLAAAVNQSRMALLLVSPSFLASDFIRGQELPALVKRGIPLVPVLLRNCAWQEVPVLEGVQWAHDPRRDVPVADSADPQHEIVRVCQVLQDLLTAEDVALDAAGTAENSAPRQAALRAASSQRGQLHGVPLLPAAFVTRDELARLRDLVLGAGGGAAGVTGKALGMSGQGGIGKTVLAAALARDDVARRHFPDGIFWVSLGEAADLAAAQADLLERLGAARPWLRMASEGVGLLREVLADRRCLLVIDDVWSAAASAAFRVAGPAGRVLYTTRDPAVLHAVGADAQQVGALPPAVARELLSGITGVLELPAEADQICAATGRVALAVALAGAAIAGGRSWGQVAAQLEDSATTFLDHPYASTFKAMQVAVAALSDADARAYRALAAYPGDTVIPTAAIGRLWSYLSGASPTEVSTRLARLQTRNLLTADDDGVSFHHLQREFLLVNTQDLSVLHADVLAAYRGLLPQGVSLTRLPADEPYIWDHLLYHLHGTGDRIGIRAVACDPGYIAMRSFLSGPYAAESDLRQAADIYPDDTRIAWLQRLLQQWGHLLVGQPTAGDLAVTLASRIRDPRAPVSAEGLAALLPPFYLAPRWGLVVREPASLTRALGGHTDEIAAVAFSPDGRLLAGACFDGMVRLWEVATGKQAAVLDGHGGWVPAVAFSPDGRLLASGGLGGVRLWEVATGEQVGILPRPDRSVRAIAFAPDRPMVAVADQDRGVRLWDMASRQPVEVLYSHDTWVNAVAFSPDGRLMASACFDKMVRLWDAGKRKSVALNGHTDQVTAVGFAPDGRMLASGGRDHSVRLWRIPDRESADVLFGHDGWVTAVTFSPDGQLLASGGAGGVLLWQVNTRKREMVTRKPVATLGTDRVIAVAFAPDGHRLASGAAGGVRLWDVGTRDAAGTRQAARVRTGHDRRITSVASVPQGNLVASGEGDATVRLWDAATGESAGVLCGGQQIARAVAFSPDGQLLADAGFDGVRVWEVATGTLTGILGGHAEQQDAVAFAPDGRLLASGGFHRLRLWNVMTGQPAATLDGPEGWVNALAFAPRENLLASGDQDGTVRLWDVAAGRQVGVLARHEQAVRAVAFAPDGMLLASASDDGTVRLWDVQTVTPVAVLNGHHGWVHTVAFAPDGQLVASGSHDGTVRLWDRFSLQAISQLTIGTAVKALTWGPVGITAATDKDLVQLAVIHPPAQ